MNTDVVVERPSVSVSASRRDVALARWAMAAAVVGAVFYSMWLVSAPLNALDPVTSFVSELTADGQPFAMLFRVTEIGAGLAVIAAALLMMRHLRDRVAPFVLLAGFGLFTIFDALAPLSCAPTLDAACRAAEIAGTVPWLHQVHSVTSSLAGGLAALAVAWAWWSERGARRADAPSWTRSAATICGVVYLVAMAWSLVEIAEWGVGIMGLAQRVSLLALAAWWVLYVAYRLRSTPTSYR
ncbi:MAG: DUF998 domain-containing protein [Mobilicoccus sp.]|nr:DUF998 domain-containing protein [Mobilicoccus sp.]